MRFIKYCFSAFLIFLVFSCKKEKPNENTVKSNYKNGFLVLCEGLFHQNNSSLAWIDLQTKEVELNAFEKVNNRLLGDTGNDMILYGGKIYITVTTSSTLEVLDKNTLKSIRQISFDYQNKIQQPRYMAAENGKVFVTSYDGLVSVLDTTSLKITKRIKVGRNPEGICSSENALFVANSGGLDFSNPDSTVMKIDLNTLKVTDTFVVGKNPGRIAADDFGNVYVVKQGDFMEDKSKLVRINVAEKTVEELAIFATNITEEDNKLYIGYYDFSSGTSKLVVFDCLSQQIIQELSVAAQEITTLYAVYPNDKENLLCLDAMNFVNSGYLRIFDKSGFPTEKYNVGLNPNTILKK